MKNDTVLSEAARITSGARAKAYGDALENAERWAALASAATGLPFRAEDYPAVMIAVKLARVKPGREWHRDSWVDIAGYARVAEMIEDGRRRLDSDGFLNGGRVGCSDNGEQDDESGS